MSEEELILNEIANFAEYVSSRKSILGLSNIAFGEITNVSGGEIGRTINKNKKGVSIHSFYDIAVNSGDTIENARDVIYTRSKLDLNREYKLEKRTNFSLLMRELFEGENTFEIIQVKTGITKLGKEPGELMKEYV